MTDKDRSSPDLKTAAFKASAEELQRLLAIMARLRDPENGCAWDREQSFKTIAPYTLEEAYEVADAIERQDWQGLCEELGDLLLQVIFHARMAEEAGLFSFTEVAAGISEKMIRRHPQVFAGASYETLAAQKAAWETIKQAEKRNKQQDTEDLFADLPRALPALPRAKKIQARAARLGFDWRNPEDIFAKIREELLELEEEVKGGNKEAAREELGDLLFAVANLARRLEIDAETALIAANHKFINRFKKMLKYIEKNNKFPESMTLEELEQAWQSIKREEAKNA